MEEPFVIGREEEKLLLERVIANTKADLVAVYGRRRIGKTYLIRTHLQKHIVLEHSGIHNVDTEVQLARYSEALVKQLNNNIPLPAPTDWFAALELTATLLKKKMRRKKVVLFLDEFPKAARRFFKCTAKAAGRDGLPFVFREDGETIYFRSGF